LSYGDKSLAFIYQKVRAQSILSQIDWAQKK